MVFSHDASLVSGNFFLQIEMIERSLCRILNQGGLSKANSLGFSLGYFHAFDHIWISFRQLDCAAGIDFAI